MRVLSLCGGALKSPNNVTSTSFNTVYLLLKDLSFEHGDTKRASYPRRHPTSLQPCIRVHQEPSTFFKQLLPSGKVLHFGKK